jgi:hypothetical protein
VTTILDASPNITTLLRKKFSKIEPESGPLTTKKIAGHLMKVFNRAKKENDFVGADQIPGITSLSTSVHLLEAALRSIRQGQVDYIIDRGAGPCISTVTFMMLSEANLIAIEIGSSVRAQQHLKSPTSLKHQSEYINENQKLSFFEGDVSLSCFAWYPTLANRTGEYNIIKLSYPEAFLLHIVVMIVAADLLNDNLAFFNIGDHVRNLRKIIEPCFEEVKLPPHVQSFSSTAHYHTGFARKSYLPTCDKVSLIKFISQHQGDRNDTHLNAKIVSDFHEWGETCSKPSKSRTPNGGDFKSFPDPPITSFTRESLKRDHLPDTTRARRDRRK